MRFNRLFQISSRQYPLWDDESYGSYIPALGLFYDGEGKGRKGHDHLLILIIESSRDFGGQLRVLTLPIAGRLLHLHSWWLIFCITCKKSTSSSMPNLKNLIESRNLDVPGNNDNYMFILNVRV